MWSDGAEAVNSPFISSYIHFIFSFTLALHIFSIFQEFEPRIFPFSSYSSRLDDVGEQKLISVSYDPEEVDTTQNRIVLIDCNEYSINHELEAAISQSNTQAIIIIKLSPEHYDVVKNYYTKFKCPILMITSESDCAIIAETVDVYSALMAKISGGDFGVSTSLPPPPTVEKGLENRIYVMFDYVLSSLLSIHIRSSSKLH